MGWAARAGCEGHGVQAAKDRKGRTEDGTSAGERSPNGGCRWGHARILSCCPLCSGKKKECKI